MALTGTELGELLKDKDGQVVVGVIDHDEHVTRYYHVEHVTKTVPPVVPEGNVLLYLGAELTEPLL